MRVLVISNDVVPGCGVPVAAPGLRAAGLAEGLRAHGHDVSISVPSGVIEAVLPEGPDTLPERVTVVDPRLLVDHIRSHGFDVVVFSNANMTPHLQPIDGVHFVFDMFAPKLLEALSSDTTDRPWQEQAMEKERGLALADEVWVNGKRKVGYALGWMLRPAVDAIRQAGFAKPSIADRSLLDRITVVEMPVPLPEGVDSSAQSRREGALRLGVAGYAQQWSALAHVHPVHEALVDRGHELHALLPDHWGGGANPAVSTAMPANTTWHSGPLAFDDFARWIQTMDLMVDVFEPSPERRFAMITRSAVALRLGVPLLHGVDSEIADLVVEYDAGWVLEPTAPADWLAAVDDFADPSIRDRKRAGAHRLSAERFAPEAALRHAAERLHAIRRP